MKYQTSLIPLTLLAATFAAVGCNSAEDVGSTDVRTNGMYANFDAIASGSGTTLVLAELRVGGDKGTYVELIGDDELTASGGDDSGVMVHAGSGERHWYEKSLDSHEGGMVVTIAFARGEDDDDAPNSTVIMPDPYSVSLADDEDEFVRGTNVEIEWNNTDQGNMNWEVDGDCIFRSSGTTSDSGSLTLRAADIKVLGTAEGDTCEVTVTLERRNAGEVDPAYGGGKFSGVQRRAITFTSTPAADEDGGAGGATN